MLLRVTWRGAAMELAVVPTVGALAGELETRTGLAPSEQSWCTRGKRVKPSGCLDASLAATGITADSRILLLGLSTGEQAAVTREIADDPLMRGFQAELQLAVSRNSSTLSPATPAAPIAFFGRIETWVAPDLTPPTSDARSLLLRLASDPGIQAVMRRRNYRVGCLTELPPVGKVGISAICLLGTNTNQGETIALRLRTDDLRGFRKYLRIRETLCHELAHNVYGDHDNDFKALNSTILGEVTSFTPPAIQMAPPKPAGRLVGAEYLPKPVEGVMEATARSSGQRLGHGEPTRPNDDDDDDDTRTAAAESFRRLGQIGG